MRYRLFTTNAFRRSFRKLSLNDRQFQAFVDVVSRLLNGVPLDKKYRDHALNGEYNGFRECHLKADLLLIYKIELGILKLVEIGSHSDLFV